MRFLVTGATGLVGNNLVRQLLEQGFPVRALARSRQDQRPFQGLDVEVVQGDIGEPASLRAACEGAAVVIHAAGLVQIGWSRREEHERVNVQGALNVAAAARQAGARLVFVSSVNALGLGRREAPANEQTALPGIVECPYVLSKRRAELGIQEEMQRGLQAVIVYPGFLLGPWDWKPSSGAMLLEVAKINPLLAPVGSYSVCDVRDVSAGIVTAAKISPSGSRYILAGHNTTYREAWRRFAKLAGKSGPWFPAGPFNRNVLAVAGDLWGKLSGREPEFNSAGVWMSVQEHCFSSALAQRELGYQIRPLQETIDDTWRWFGEYGYREK